VTRLDTFLAHWKSIPRSGGMPTLSDYLDRPHPAIQPWTIIIDLKPDALPMRLFGMGLADMVGRDVTGLDYLQGVRVTRRRHVLARDHMCATHPCGLRIELLANTQTGRTFVNTVLALPVKRANKGYSLVRVSDVQNFLDRDRRASAMAILHYNSAAWVDIGSGIPPTAPWSEGPAETAS